MFINNATLELFQTALTTSAAEGAKALFTKGEIIEGRVIQAMSQNKAMVLVNGQKMLATTQAELMEGQKFLGRVEQASAPLKISILTGQGGKGEKLNETLRILLPGKEPLGESLSKALALQGNKELPPQVAKTINTLGERLRATLPKGFAGMTAPQAEAAIRKSGVFLESEIRKAVTQSGGKGGLPPALQKELTGAIKGLVGKAMVNIEGEAAKLAQKIETETGRNRVTTDTQGTKKTSALPQPNVPANEQPMAPTKKTPYHFILSAHKEKNASSSGRTTDALLADLTKTREAARDLKGVLNNIELNQLINANADRKSAGPALQALYQIPFFEGENLKNARVYFQKDPKESGGGAKKQIGDHSLVFMLTMSELGPVRADVTVNRGAARGVVSVADDKTAAHLREKLPDLLRPLEENGYHALFEVKVAGQNYLTEELESGVALAPQGLINLTA